MNLISSSSGFLVLATLAVVAHGWTLEKHHSAPDDSWEHHACEASIIGTIRHGNLWFASHKNGYKKTCTEVMLLGKPFHNLPGTICRDLGKLPEEADSEECMRLMIEYHEECWGNAVRTDEIVGEIFRHIKHNHERLRGDCEASKK